MIPFVGPMLVDMFMDQEDFRELPEQNESLPPHSGDLGIDVCTRPAFGTGETGDALGIDHWWFDTLTSAMGLGSDDTTLNPLDTTMVDHSGARDQEGAMCAPVEELFPEHANVDPQCVEDAMQPGATDFGLYGIDEICKDAIDVILAKCDPDPEDQVTREF